MVSILTTYVFDFQDKPHQPRNFSFPKRPFGKMQIVQRSFQPQWFPRWKWHHYDEALHVAFCHLYGKADQEKTQFQNERSRFSK